MIRPQRLVPLAPLLAGCLHGAVSGNGQPQRVALLPVESEDYPDVARAVNAGLTKIRDRGGPDYVLSRVPLEVVQLSIECVEATPACYEAVGHNLGVDRLLLVSVAPGASKGAVKVGYTLYDLGKHAAAGDAEREYGSANDAAGDVEALAQQALAPAAAGGPAR
jgi:hypothetical protein